MVRPSQKYSINRVNFHWLLNAASLAVAIGAINQVAKSNGNKCSPSLVTELSAVDYTYAGGSLISSSSGTAVWWSAAAGAGYSTKAAGTAADSTFPTISTADNLYFGASAPMAGTSSWSSSINFGSSNQTAMTINFVSGANSYTILAPHTKKFTTGGSATAAAQTSPLITNASSSAITFAVILTPSVGASSTSAAIFKQSNATGSLNFVGAPSPSSYIMNPYAYDWALSTGSTAAQAKIYAASSTAQNAIAVGTNSGGRYLNLDGSGTINVNAGISDAWRGNGGSSFSAFSVSGYGNLVISNTGTTNLNGWNTYTGTTTIGSSTTSGGTVVIGNPYAFGGNRLAERTDPYNLVNTAPGGTAYSVGTNAYTLNAYMVGGTSAYSITGNVGAAGGAGTIASGFSYTTQAFGAVTVNSGFTVDLNGITMIGANPMNISGAGAAGTGVIKNSSTNAATYAGLITVGNTSTMSVGYGNITMSGGVNTTSKTLTIDGASNTYITGPLSGSTGGRIQKLGTGTLTISGTNTSPGTLKVVAGSVIISSPDALSTTGILDSGSSTADTGTLVLTGGLANSNNYQTGTLTPGGNLNLSTVNGSSTITFTALTGSGQSGSTEKRISINSGVNVIISGAFDLIGSSATGNRYFRIDGEGNITFDGEIRNNASGSAAAFIGGINKNSGGGTLTLNGANTFNLGVILGAGTINLGSVETPGVSGPLGSSGSIVLNGGYLQYTANNQHDYSSRFDTLSTNPQKYNVDTNGQNVTWATALTSANGSLTKIGSGTLTLSADNSYSGGTTVQSGILKLNSSNTLGTAGTITLSGGTLQYTVNDTNDYSARFSNAASQKYNLDTNGVDITAASALSSVGGTLTKSGNGTLTLSGANTYTGDTTVSQGTLATGIAGALSSSSAVIVSSGATLNLNSNNQTLKGLAGAGTVTMGSANLTIGDGDSRTFSGDIGGSGNLIKSGSGIQTLSSALTYTGSTAINAGTLRVNNSLASSTVTVAGSATLEGKGTISGSVTVANNGIITAGDSTLAADSRGALTLSSLTFSGSGVINLANVNTNSSSSILNVGALSALGGAGSIIINISNSTQLDDNSTFTLLSYTSLDDFSAFTKGTISGTYDRQIKTIVNDTTNKLITLTTTGDTLKWTGGQSLTPVWTTAADNQNWKLSSSNTVTDYLASDIVAFDDFASIYVVTLGEDVSPGSLTFNNSTNNYTINSTTASTFGITGAGQLTKNGSARVDINAPFKTSGGITVNNGTLALNNSANTFTGNIALNGSGNLEVGATGALGTTNSLSFGSGATGKLSLNGYNGTLTGLSNNSSSPGSPIIENGSSTTNSTLTLNLSSGTSTFDGLIRNGGANALALTKTGAGKLILTADNTATGLITISAGTLQLGSGGTSGSVAGDISIGASGTLTYNRSNSLSFSKAISGSGTFNITEGQLELLGTNTFSGTLSISTGASLSVGSSGILSSSAAITNNGSLQYNSNSTASLGAISGSGNLSVLSSTLTQAGTNSLTGGITIGAGATYSIGSGGSFTSASGVVNNGTLSFGNRSTDYTLSQAITGTGNVIFNTGSRVIYLTGNNTYLGTTTLSSGTLNVGNGGATGQLGTGAITLATGSELILSSNSDSTIYGTISGGGKMTLAGTGKVTLDSNSSISITNEFKIGTSAGSAVHSSLDLSAASASVSKFTVQTDATNSPSSFNNIVIGSGKNLNVSGLVTIGLDNGSNPTTNLTMSGDGSLNIGTLVSPTNLNVNVGASISSSKINYVNWDMSGLANLTMYLGTGTFNIGADTNSTGSTGGTGTGDTVKLATNSTIVGTTLLMDAVSSSKTFILSLGSGVNTINVDTLTVSGASTRAESKINFNSGTGSLIVRSKSGGRATLNIQNATNSTGSNQTGSIDLSGHSADLLLGTVTVGSRLSLIGSGVGYGSGYLAFDTGTFDASTLNIANKSHNGTAIGNLSGKTASSSLSGNLIALASFGGGTVTLGAVDVARHGASNVGGTVQGLIEFLGTNTSSVGAVTLATASSSVLSGTSAATAYLNIADGAVTIASISGASAASNTLATANVNVSGGSLTMGGNVTRTGGTGTSAFNFNLSGGTLDMGGHSIGSSTSPIAFNWTKGTLQNVSGLNGTVGITVNTSDPFTPLYLAGTNTFTSQITINESVLQLDSSTALAANSKIGFDGTWGVLKLGSSVSIDVSGNLASGNAQFDTNGNNVTFNNSVTGLTSFTKLGSGKLTLSSTSATLAPTVSIQGGTLEIGSGDHSIPAGGFLNGTTVLNLDAVGGSPELIANGVKVDLNADVNLLNSGATISGSKGLSAYSFNFIKDIISADNAAATISATDMTMGSGSHINVGAGATLTISGSFIDNTDNQQATQITKNGTGLLEITGTGNTYSGATTINAGTVTITQGALTGASTSITVNNTATLTATDLDSNVSITVASGGTADISGSDIAVKNIVTENSTDGAFTFSGSSGKVTATSLSGSGHISFGADLEVDTLTGAGTVVLSNSTPTITVGEGTFSGTLVGTGSLVKKGTGTLTLSGSNTLTGSVTLNDGIVSVSDLATLSGATDSPENLVFQGGKLKYTGSGATMTRGFTVGDGGAGFLASGTGALEIGQDVSMDFADATASNRTLSLGGTSDIAVENIFNPNKIDGADVTNLFTKLVKQDTNKWIVLGAGAGFVDDAQTEIDIQNGELGFAMGALGSNSTITMGATNLGEIATLGWASGNTEDVSARVNLRNAAVAAFDIPSGNTVTFASPLNSGNVSTTSVVKSGEGILNLNATNSFSGGFTISGGTVKLGITGALGSGNVSVNTNSTLVVNAVISNTININTGGSLTSDQNNQQVEDVTVEEGGIIIPGGSAVGTMTAHNLTLKGGSIVNWQITNALGAVDKNYSLAGIGYDTFILNSLALTNASITNRVHVMVKGDMVSNFDKEAVQTFQFAKLTNKLSLTEAAHVTDLFNVDASEFEYINGLQTDHLVWRMTVSADREYLYVVAIPEPSTFGLGLGALAIAAAAVRRRKLKKQSPAV